MEHKTCPRKEGVRGTVDGVPQDGAIQVTQVYPKLMGPAGFRPEAEEGIFSPGTDDPVSGDCGFSLFKGYGKTLTVAAVPAYPGFNNSPPVF